MEYNYNEKSIKDRITKLNEHTYTISFKIPTSLQDDYNMLVEEDIGYDDCLIVEDCTEEIKDNFILGYIVLSLNDSTDNSDIPDIIFGRASQFDMLSNGVSLIEEVK